MNCNKYLSTGKSILRLEIVAYSAFTSYFTNK